MARKVRDMPDVYDARRKYDWNKLLDGSTWALTPGEDFSCTSAGFANAARDYAQRHGIAIRVSVPANKGGIVYLRRLSGDAAEAKKKSRRKR